MEPECFIDFFLEQKEFYNFTLFFFLPFTAHGFQFDVRGTVLVESPNTNTLIDNEKSN